MSLFVCNTFSLSLFLSSSIVSVDLSLGTEARQPRATCAFFSHRSRAYSNFARFTPCPSFLFTVVLWFIFFFACLSVCLVACLYTLGGGGGEKKKMHDVCLYFTNKNFLKKHFESHGSPFKAEQGTKTCRNVGVRSWSNLHAMLVVHYRNMAEMKEKQDFRRHFNWA